MIQSVGFTKKYAYTRRRVTRLPKSIYQLLHVLFVLPPIICILQPQNGQRDYLFSKFAIQTLEEQNIKVMALGYWATVEWQLRNSRSDGERKHGEGHGVRMRLGLSFERNNCRRALVTKNVPKASAAVCHRARHGRPFFCCHTAPPLSFSFNDRTTNSDLFAFLRPSLLNLFRAPQSPLILSPLPFVSLLSLSFFGLLSPCFYLGLFHRTFRSFCPIHSPLCRRVLFAY
jgi:hypothetical protein